MPEIRVGIGGWTFAPWRGTFFPAGLPHAQELSYASARLTSIEINGTFYRHQSPASFAAWRDATPDGFVFSMKAHRATTHTSDPARLAEAVPRFLTSGITELGAKLGPILWQFPPFRKFAPDTLELFLALLPPTQDGATLRHVVEARHPSFSDPAAIALFRQYNVAVAVIDSDKQKLHGDLTADFAYARLERNDVAEPEGYASAALDAWTTRTRAWASGLAVDDLPLAGVSSNAETAREVFVYFISGDKQRAPDAATAFLARLNA